MPGSWTETEFLRYGVAVLAYDRRGYTTNEDAWREPDLDDLSADAAAAVRFAAGQAELDADRIGILGSSQGGWVVPRAAVEAQETDFIILRAGASEGSFETVLHEVRQELRLEGLEGWILTTRWISCERFTRWR
ncbi:MAG: alpha/beta hydrolase family protein [bacterium]